MSFNLWLLMGRIDRSRGLAAGVSADAAYRYLRRRRRRIRWGTAATALVALIVGMALLTSALFRPDGSGRPTNRGRLEAAAVAVGLAVALGGLLRIDRYGGRDVERWARGAEGERRTEVLLRELPGRRWVVWHDLAVPGSRANVDHLVVGRTGVWVVDTKTTRSSVRCGWRSVQLGDRRLDTGSTAWEAEVLTGMLEAGLAQAGGRPLAGRERVRPLVAVHAPEMRPRGARVGGVPVVPAAMLDRRLRRGRRRVGRHRMVELVTALEARFGPPAHGGRGRRRSRGAVRVG